MLRPAVEQGPGGKAGPVVISGGRHKARDVAADLRDRHASKNLRRVRGEHVATSRIMLARDPVNRLLFLDLATWLHDDLLMKVDKMSMLASLEARVPFLDYRVVEFMFSLPGSYKIRNGKSKALLRAAFSDLIPPRTLKRSKHGFALPIHRWLRNELRTFVQDHFASQDDSFYDHLDRRAVQAILDQVYRQDLDRSLPLWILLSLKVWCRHFLRGVPEISLEAR